MLLPWGTEKFFPPLGPQKHGIQYVYVHPPFVPMKDRKKPLSKDYDSKYAWHWFITYADGSRFNNGSDDYFLTLWWCKNDAHSVETIPRILNIDLFPRLAICGTVLPRDAGQWKLNDFAQLQASVSAMSMFKVD